MNTEIKIRSLILRHTALCYSEWIEHSRLITDAMSRIEIEYIELTGYEIRNNPEHKRLLENYDKILQHETIQKKTQKV